MENGSLRIEIVKRSDGSGLLRCHRADGSVTWQKQPERHAGHFTLHDLTHYAVETVLRYGQGFFGLIAAGWDIEDTTGKGARGPLPDEAFEVESLVGLFDRERESGKIWTAGEFAEAALGKLTRKLDDASIRAIRSTRTELFRRWAAVEIASTFELEYTVPPRVPGVEARKRGEDQDGELQLAETAKGGLGRVHREIRAGRADSVAGYISRVLAEHERSESLGALLLDLIEQHGEPTAEDIQWTERTLPSRRG